MTIPILFQRLESAAILAAATGVYFANHLSWVWYIVLFFAFDIFMAGYLFGSRIGGITYNLGHSYILPSLIVIAYIIHHNNFLLGFACLWSAHIGLDRALGYGLKLSTGFKHTHLGTIGK